jgi:hypothetical protein
MKMTDAGDERSDAQKKSGSQRGEMMDATKMQ